MRHTLVALAWAWLGLVSTAWGDETSLLWIEGENALRRTTHSNAWFDAIDPAELSGGAQIANFSEAKQPSGSAEYDFMVPTAGRYRFWLRANPGTGLLYAVNGSGWLKLDTDAIKKEDQAQQRTKGYVSRARQTTNVAADGTHDARLMTWYNLGTLRLAEGKNSIQFNLGGEQPGEKRFAAIDCFVLSDGHFTPKFQYKLGEKSTAVMGFQEGESWAFTPNRDTLSPTALFDLRFLNEKSAGEHGFIGISPDGDSFVRGDGQPVRFWGGSTYVQRIARQNKTQAILLRHAGFLAKRGVNIVRICDFIEPKQKGSRVTDVDENVLDEIYRTVAAMKRFGIYTVISPFWPTHAHALKSWGLPMPAMAIARDCSSSIRRSSAVIRRGSGGFTPM